MKTTRRGWRMAMMAAMKKVLSPSSETTITDSDATKPCMADGPPAEPVDEAGPIEPDGPAPPPAAPLRPPASSEAPWPRKAKTKETVYVFL